MNGDHKVGAIAIIVISLLILGISLGAFWMHHAGDVEHTHREVAALHACRHAHNVSACVAIAKAS